MPYWGENGAGKSTLMKIIYGICTSGQRENPDKRAGSEYFRSVCRPEDGIGMVFQHFSLFETLTAAENISLTTENTGDRDAIRQRIRELSDRYGLDIHPDKPIISLSVGERQRVEIIRCLMQNPTLLIMDEPTSVLTRRNAPICLKRSVYLPKRGRAILYISHKLEEIRSLCGRATVLRGGKHIGECDPRSESTKSMAEMMIGKKIDHVHKEQNVWAEGRAGNDADRKYPAQHSSREEYCFTGTDEYEKAEKTANAVIKHYDVRTPGNSAEAGSLSGGNLQKFIVGREVEQNPKLLVISAPTWGVDAGAEVFIRQTLADKAKQGMAIILFSQDLDEVMELSDRVAVMFSGRLSPAYPAKNSRRNKSDCSWRRTFD
ncbi:hypothetical protein CHS0354_006920 [Potamilus streckersoni]|uniref:ABC transporter domain-containing protein n=1 Tax=Potamilus streckersoni TaxID=2493646 RepID=A0AAE0WC79_9BIVA|nr:hypothetical protein CHS0354_006920 [Potamilus streckersoni]